MSSPLSNLDNLKIYSKYDNNDNLELVVKNKNGLKVINTEMEYIDYISVRVNIYVNNLEMSGPVLLDIFEKYVDKMDKVLDDNHIVWIHSRLNYGYNTIDINILKYDNNIIEKLPTIFEMNDIKINIEGVEYCGNISYDYEESFSRDFEYFYNDN